MTSSKIADTSTRRALTIVASVCVWAQPALAFAQPTITITSVPAYATNGFMEGTVTGVDFSAYRVAAYIQIEELGWWTKPTFATPTVPINPNGTFSISVTTGGLDNRATILCAALVAAGSTPPLANGSRRIPAQLNAAAIRCQERYGRTISFAGRTWAVKEAPSPVGQASNRFSDDPSDVWVDAAGLHLTIHQRNGQWWSTEVILLDHLGYGSYVFKTASRTDILDLNAVLGMFTWDSYGDDETSGGSHNREIDFEDSRWNAQFDPNTQAVVQPFNVPGNRHRYNLPNLEADQRLTRIFNWKPSSISFVALTGHQPPENHPPASVFDNFTYNHDPVSGHYVPPRGRERVRLNLWLNVAAPPSNGQPIEVVITDFSFVPNGPTMSLDKTSLRFGATSTGTAFAASTSNQSVSLTQSGAGTVTWTATANAPWLVVSPASGSGPATVDVGVRYLSGLPTFGPIGGLITFSFTGAANLEASTEVVLNLIPNGMSANSFGTIDTPLNNTTGVTGAIPFTGWALDDVEVLRVMICRAAFGAEVAPVDPNCGGTAQIFVGFAVFIDGARPDVAAAYPAFPVNTRGGWGFMVLTNTLPSQGNGTFVFHMWAQDRDGHTIVLGTRTMTCANASSILPFGAIDTPTQGGTASGASFVNFGWALTPQPKLIPLNGSTITVLVDGASLGTVDYNHERPDIETLFPGFQNTAGTNGAIGFRVINTTTMTNGLHTISWTVIDNQGAIEGIGSRFFTVSNGAGALTAAEGAASSRVIATAGVIAGTPHDDAPVLGRRGWDLEGSWRRYGVGRAGRAVIRGEEIDRFELWLGTQSGEHYTGYLRVGDGLAVLPVGSQLDAATGAFTWAPGVGFVGTYDLVFVRWAGTRAVTRHEVRVILAPKGRGHVGVQVAIDTPRSQQDVGQPFVLAGWAADLDAATGTGIDTLHVWAYPRTGGAPVFLGTPTLGGVRLDVAAVHGDQFREAGFALTVQGLIPGTYDLVVFPWSNVTGGFAQPRSVHVTLR